MLILVGSGVRSSRALPVVTPQTAEYLLVATAPRFSLDASVSVTNFELGANTWGVPMTSLMGGPSLPAAARSVGIGIGGNGDIAVTNPDGEFDLWNTRLWGETGIDCAGPASSCEKRLVASEFNGISFTKTDALDGEVDLSGVTLELLSARADLEIFEGDQSLMLDFRSSDGKWITDHAIDLESGTTVIDILTGGEDLVLEDVSLLIDGPVGSKAVFRLPDEGDFRVIDSNVVVGDGGIGLTDVLFYTDQSKEQGRIVIDSAVINGVAFWNLSPDIGEIVAKNVQGCSQFVAGRIELTNARLNHCGVSSIPEPGTALLMAFGLTTLVVGPRRLRWTHREPFRALDRQSVERP
ncbi:hypothetical protein MK489_09800 [Myxococcota bacterium]|nr:hypothetical protein [Myxococcota bacterium]